MKAACRLVDGFYGLDIQLKSPGDISKTLLQAIRGSKKPEEHSKWQLFRVEKYR